MSQPAPVTRGLFGRALQQWQEQVDEYRQWTQTHRRHPSPQSKEYVEGNLGLWARGQRYLRSTGHMPASQRAVIDELLKPVAPTVTHREQDTRSVLDPAALLAALA